MSDISSELWYAYSDYSDEESFISKKNSIHQVVESSSKVQLQSNKLKGILEKRLKDKQHSEVQPIEESKPKNLPLTSREKNSGHKSIDIDELKNLAKKVKATKQLQKIMNIRMNKEESKRISKVGNNKQEFKITSAADYNYVPKG